jgi:AbiV family abortive infection protein
MSAMATVESKKEIIEGFNRFRAVSLKNSEDLLKAAKLSLDVGIDHAAFHLSLLAFEEIGKVEMEMIKTLAMVHPEGEPINFSFEVDDHEKKIFWAFWGPSFGRQKQTKELIDSKRTVAKNLHNRRLLYLYSDPVDPRYWGDLMEQGEAKMLYEFTEARLKLELAKADLDEAFVDEPHEDLVWFFKVNEDEERRKEVWGNISQDKLIELGDVKEWIKWLREVYTKHETEMQGVAQKEMRRQQPSEEEKMDSKWRIRLEIFSPSHSIRQKNLTGFNSGVNWITLTRKDAHLLGIELLLPKNIPIQGLWEHGWGIARMFIASLNAATTGFFWWNIKRDPSRYYDEIWDLENDLGVIVEMSPRLEMGWREKRFVLRPVDLSLTSIVFSYMLDCHIAKKEEHLNHYANGLSLIAKNDVHLRVEMPAFEEFLKSLKLAMIENGDWDQIEPFEEAYQRATAWRFHNVTDDMKKIFPLGFQVENDHTGFVDLTSAYAMKNYCEIYLQTLALRHYKDINGQEIRLVMDGEVEEEGSATA